MNTIYIYKLTDPLDNSVRYIGKSNYPTRRYKQHLEDKKNKNKAQWIKSLRDFNLQPEMEIIEECDETNWADREIYWIRYYRENNAELFNIANGGQPGGGGGEIQVRWRGIEYYLPDQYVREFNNLDNQKKADVMIAAAKSSVHLLQKAFGLLVEKDHELSGHYGEMAFDAVRLSAMDSIQKYSV